MKTGLSTRTGISFSKSPGIKLNFDAQTGLFTPGNPITQAVSGATATVLEEIGGETLTLTGLSGTFQDDEMIYESALGAEIFTGTDSDMSGANNWYSDTTGTFDVNTTVAGKAYLLGGGTTDFCRIDAVSTVGLFYLISYDGRLNTGSSPSIRAGFNIAALVSYFSSTFTGTEQTFTGYVLAGSVDLIIGVIGSALNGDAIEIDNVSIKQVTNAALANGTVY